MDLPDVKPDLIKTEPDEPYEPLTVPSTQRERSRSPLPRPSSSTSATASDQNNRKQLFYKFINFCSLCRLTSTNAECIEFCQHFGLLPKSIICTSCGAVLTNLKEKCGRLQFACMKRKCRKHFSAKKDTWFENRKLSLRKALFLTYLFVSKSDVKSAVRETSGPDFNFECTSIETVVDFFTRCRDVCIRNIFSSEIPEKLGGTNYIVEIDKTKFGKKWVLGGICRENKECFFVPVEDFNQETVISIIQQRVAGGTLIYTDGWAGYKTLSDLGFQHYTVDHSKHFVDPETGVSTSLITSTWWALKRSIPFTHSSHEALAAHLAEYLWRRKNQKAICLFNTFLEDIVRLYPGA